MKYNFLRAACATPSVEVANCEYNTNEIIKNAKAASENGADVVVFPELSITGYTCADLFEQTTLLNSAVLYLEKIVDESKTFFH